LTAIALLLVYGAYLIFQLGTHQDLFSDGEDEAQHEPLLTLTAAFLWLGGITVVVAFLSEYLTGSLESVSCAGPTAVCCTNSSVLLLAGNSICFWHETAAFWLLEVPCFESSMLVLLLT
jgi:Ca2+/H+ antiporter